MGEKSTNVHILNNAYRLYVYYMQLLFVCLYDAGQSPNWMKSEERSQLLALSDLDVLTSKTTLEVQKCIFYKACPTSTLIRHRALRDGVPDVFCGFRGLYARRRIR